GITRDRAASESPAVPKTVAKETGLRGTEGAGAAQARSAPAGSGAADRGQSPEYQVGAEGTAGAARRAGGVGGVDLQPADPGHFAGANSKPVVCLFFVVRC